MQNSHIYWLYAFILGNIIEKVFSFGSVEDGEGNGEKKFFIVNLSFWKRVFIMYTYIFFSYRKIVTTFLLIVGLINKFLHIIFNIRIKLPNLNDDVIKKILDHTHSFSTVAQTATPTYASDTDLHIAFRYFFVFTSDPIAAYIPHAHIISCSWKQSRVTRGNMTTRHVVFVVTITSDFPLVFELIINKSLWKIEKNYLSIVWGEF